MNCHNHPEKEATCACVGCGKFFCAECTTEIHGKSYCKPCLEETMDKKDAEIKKAEEKPTQVFMNAGGAASSSSSSSSGGGGVVPPYPRSSCLLHIILFLCTGGIGNIIYWLITRSRRKEWKAQYRR